MTGIYIGLGIIVLLTIVLLAITIRLIIKAQKQKKIREGHRQMLLKIIDSGGENVTDNNGNTPLILSVRYGFLDVFDKLLIAEADLDASDNNGNTALHFAAALNNITVLDRLNEKGVNLNAQSKNGTTPIMVAIKARTYEAVEFLLDKKVVLTIKNADGQDAIKYAKDEWENEERQKTDSSKAKKKQTVLLKKMNAMDT